MVFPGSGTDLLGCSANILHHIRKELKENNDIAQMALHCRWNVFLIIWLCEGGK